MHDDLPTLDNVQQHHDSHRGRFVVDTLYRHWFLIAVSTIACAVAGGVIDTFRDQGRFQYWAETDLAIKQSTWQSPALASLGTSVFGEVSASGLVNQLDMAAFSRDVAEALVQDDISSGKHGGGLTADRELDKRSNQLLSMLTIEPNDAKGTLKVRVHSSMDEEDALRTAEYTARAIVEYTRQQKLNSQQKAHDDVQDQLASIREELDKADGAQWDFREEMGYQTHAQVWEEIERRNRELLTAAATKEQVLEQLDEIELELGQNALKLPGALENVTESVVRDILVEIDALRAEELEMSVVWKPGYPGLDRVQADIEDKKLAVLKAIAGLGAGSGGSSLWQTRQDLYNRKVDLNSQLTNLRIRSASLQKIIQGMTDGLPALADKSLEFSQLSHEAKQVRDQFNLLMQKEFELRTALSRGTATVERRNAAVPLAAPPSGGPPLSTSMIIGALIGVALSFGYAMLREMNDTSIKSATDLRTFVGLEDIGTIPEMRSGRARRNRKKGVDPVVECIVTQHDPKSPISEAYRSLRTNFQFATLQHEPKSIMVTSSLPGEGKTTTAINFAVTMSDLGKRVLIIDTDLRRPNVHRTLQMERGLGLADVLRGQALLNDVIRPTRTNNLWMVSSGRVPANPSELLGSETMTSLMKSVTDSFDLVVCDAPSALIVTDPVILATHTDSIILVVSVNRTRRETILRAKKTLETANPNIAGAVLNGIQSSSRHFYFYYYYDERSKDEGDDGPAPTAEVVPETAEPVGAHSDSPS